MTHMGITRGKIAHLETSGYVPLMSVHPVELRAIIEGYVYAPPCQHDPVSYVRYSYETGWERIYE